VHLVQVNGFGGQAAGANGTGPVLEPLVGEIARYVETAGLKKPAVMGHSMGGEAALLLAARRPELFGRVMAVDALPFFSLLINPNATPESVRPQADAARDALLGMTDAQYRASQPTGMARLVKDPAARERHARVSAASDKAVVARVMHEIMTTDIRPLLAKNTVPITVLYAFDPTMGAPPAVMDRLWTGAYQGIPNVRLVRVDGAYHFIMDDQPERFAQEVKAFLGAG
jgi:pimeloyl-ACP methyl ester carboxylesterase